jgi:hypothetical protein
VKTTTSVGKNLDFLNAFFDWNRRKREEDICHDGGYLIYVEVDFLNNFFFFYFLIFFHLLSLWNNFYPYVMISFDGSLDSDCYHDDHDPYHGLDHDHGHSLCLGHDGDVLMIFLNVNDFLRMISHHGDDYCSLHLSEVSHRLPSRSYDFHSCQWPLWRRLFPRPSFEKKILEAEGVGGERAAVYFSVFNGQIIFPSEPTKQNAAQRGHR